MKTFKLLSEELLSEAYDHDRTWQSHKDKLVDRIKQQSDFEDHDSAETNAHALVYHAERGVKNKKYVPKILDMITRSKMQRYGKDHTAVREMGGHFNAYDELAKTNKLKPEHKNWKAFKSAEDVKAVVEHPAYHHHWNETAHKKLNSLPAGSFHHYEDEHAHYIVPHTHDAARAAAHSLERGGNPAAWCFSADSSESKRIFGTYNRPDTTYSEKYRPSKNKTGLVIVHPKKPTHPGEMYGMHVDPTQYVPHKHKSHETRDEDNKLISASKFRKKIPHPNSFYQDLVNKARAKVKLSDDDE